MRLTPKLQISKQQSHHINQTVEDDYHEHSSNVIKFAPIIKRYDVIQISLFHITYVTSTPTTFFQ